MTILETFIRLRDDIKAWVTNNLKQKADISYVDEKFNSIAEFDPTEIQKAIDANTANIGSNADAIEEIKGALDEKADADHTHNDLQEQLEQKSQVQIITWEEND